MQRSSFYKNEVEVMYLDSRGRLWVVVSPDLHSGPTIACQNPDAVREAVTRCTRFEPNATIRVRDDLGIPREAFVCSPDEQDNYADLARVCEGAP